MRSGCKIFHWAFVGLLWACVSEPVRAQDLNLNVTDSSTGRQGFQKQTTVRYEPKAFYEASQSWLKKMEDQGRPFARLVFKWDTNLVLRPETIQVRQPSEAIHGSLELHSGPFMVLDSLIFWGDHKSRPSYLKGLADLNKGMPYSESALKRSARRILAQEHLTLVAPPVVYFTTRGAVIGYGLRSRSVSWADLILGFRSKPQGGIEFNGQGQLNLKNSLGHGEDLLFHINWLPVGSRTMDLSLRFPWPWGLPVIPSGALHLFKQDTSWLRVRYGGSLGYLADPGTEVSLRLNRELSLVSAEGISGVEEYRTWLSGVGINVKKAYPVGNPSRGAEGRASLDGGLRKAGTSAAESAQEQIWHAQAQGGWFLQVLERHVLRPGFQAESIWGGGISMNQWPLLGGTNGLRGTTPHSLLTMKYAIANAEYRFLLDQDSHLYAGFLHAAIQDGQPSTFGSYQAVYTGFRILLNRTRLDLGYSMGRFLPQEFSPDKGLVDIGLRNYF